MTNPDFSAKTCSHCRRGHHRTCSGQAMRATGERSTADPGRGTAPTPLFVSVACNCKTYGHPQGGLR